MLSVGEDFLKRVRAFHIETAEQKRTSNTLEKRERERSNEKEIYLYCSSSKLKSQNKK